MTNDEMKRRCLQSAAALASGAAQLRPGIDLGGELPNEPNKSCIFNKRVSGGWLK
jgi:hypothetical protein